jgi:hypothetical protein
VTKSFVITESAFAAQVREAAGQRAPGVLSSVNIGFYNNQANMTFNAQLINRSISGEVTFTTVVSNCRLSSKIISAKVGQREMGAARKAVITSAINQALAASLAPAGVPLCIESATIGDGKITVVYRTE